MRESYVKPRTKEERLNPLINGVIQQVVKELKEIIRKDIKRRMIESTGFKSFENWWDENETQAKIRSKELLEKSAFVTKDMTKSSQTETNSNSVIKSEDVWSTISTNLFNSPVKQPAFAGLGLGLGRLIPKMPSFRRKFKAPSPVPDDDWEAAEKADHITRDTEPQNGIISDSDGEKGSPKSQLSGSSSDNDSESGSESSSESSSSSEKSSSLSEDEDEEDERVKRKEKQNRFSSSSDDESVSQAKERESEAAGNSVMSDAKDDSQLAAEALVELATGRSPSSQSPEDRTKEKGSGTDSAPESDAVEKELSKPVTCVDFDHSYALPSQTTLDSVIDDVVKSSVQEEVEAMAVDDHGYSRNKSENKTKNRKEEARVSRPVASEWRKAKQKAKVEIQMDESPVRCVTPKPQFRKRSVVEEMDILYEFLRIGIDEEDVQYIRRTYESMLREESQYWLNDTHWVDHPATLIPSPKKRKKGDDVRVHVTGCARSEGYYKMDDNEKRQHSHVASVTTEVDPKLRARTAIAQTSTREARSYQRKLLASAELAQSELCKFNLLQVSVSCSCCPRLVSHFRPSVP